MTTASIGLYKEIYSLQLRKLMTYRSEFWFRFLGVLLANATVAYFLWRAVFATTGESSLGGFTLAGMVLYYLLVPLTEGVSRSHEPGFLSWEVYEGTLTRYLVYPVDFFSYQYVVNLAGATVALVQLVIVLAIYVAVVQIPPEFHLSVASVGLGVLTALAASVLNFALVSAVEMTAFWAENVWSLNVMLMFATRLLGGAMLPLSLFPQAAQSLLMWTPFPYLVAFPIRALMGSLSVTDWLRGMTVMVAWTLAVLLLNKAIWRRGNLRYTGVGI